MTTKKRSTKTVGKAFKAKKKKAKPSKKTASKARPAPKSAGKPTSSAKAARKGAKKAPAHTKAAVKKKSATKGKLGGAKAAGRKTRAVSAKQATKRVRSAALKLYESGLKLAHSEKFNPAKEKFKELIEQFPGEIGLLDRAHILIQACDKRIMGQRSRPSLKTADDFYEVGVTELNGRRLDEAQDYFERALKLEPKADYVFYALAAVCCLRGERDAALVHLKRAIQYRGQNRFLARNDADFASLSDDPEFIELITSE